jgi:hypothetical protein
MTPSHTPDPPSDALSAQTLRSPDALIAALPYLLGFHPAESAVVVWLSSRRLLLTQRLDLPADDACWPDWAETMWRHPAADDADELVLVLVTARCDVARARTVVQEQAAATGISVRDVLRVHGSRWWSLLCGDPACCPAEGRELDPRVQSAVAAEFTVLGIAPLAAREDLVDALAADPDGVAALAAHVDRELTGRPPGEAREQWRDDHIAAIVEALSGGPGADGPRGRRLAAVVVGLGDVRVRDTVLWECSGMGRDELAGALEVLAAATRCAPAGHVAPAATCAALLAWLSGDGARASVAADRALADDPGYSLAVLVARSLRVGLPPSSWREATSGLTRSDCRYGTGPAAGRRAS